MKREIDRYLKALDIIGDAMAKSNANLQEANAALLKSGELFFKKTVANIYAEAIKEYNEALDKLKGISSPAQLKDEHVRLVGAYNSWVESVTKTNTSICEKSLERYFAALRQQADAQKETMDAAVGLRKKISGMLAQLAEEKKAAKEEKPEQLAKAAKGEAAATKTAAPAEKPKAKPRAKTAKKAE